MIKRKDLAKIVDLIETYYHIKLSDNETKAISEEMKDYTYEDFLKYFKKPLISTVDFFTVAKLSSVIEEQKRADDFLKRSGYNSWDELYDN